VHLPGVAAAKSMAGGTASLGELGAVESGVGPQRRHRSPVAGGGIGGWCGAHGPPGGPRSGVVERREFMATVGVVHPQQYGAPPGSAAPRPWAKNCQDLCHFRYGGAMTSADSSRRVAVIANGTQYIGPALAREMAARQHDLVIGDPADGLVDELTSMGVAVAGVDGVRDGDPAGYGALVAAAHDRFGRMDAAVAFSGRIVTGPFLTSTEEDLATVVKGCLEAPYAFLKAVVPPMVGAGDGQVLVVTSAAGARPTPGAPLYSAARAGANHLVANVAAEVAKYNVQVNALGTNFMDFPAFLAASGANDPEVRARLERAVPMRRLGTLTECAAMCAAFLDGSSRFTTGQFLAYAGGWA
jgi:NAD(P)-dependent dehydrogenase (short-subunit alcohol dehydrogenase family)